MNENLKGIAMKNRGICFFMMCCMCFVACNQSEDIEVLNPTPAIEDSNGRDMEFTVEQLKLPMKKGACFTLREIGQEGNYIQNMEKVIKLNVGWNYCWGVGIAPNQPSYVEFVPMSWGGFDPKEFLKRALPEVNSGNYKRFLAFNEPDGKEQANMSIEKALQLWPVLESLKIPLGSPAVVDAENGVWMADFMAEVERLGYRVDYLCVHNYGGGGAEAFKTKLTNIYEKFKRPILITEFAVADWNATSVEKNKHSKQKVLGFMKEILPWLEETEFIYGYSWFSFYDTDPVGCTSALFKADGTLTELGQFYADFPKEQEPTGENLVLNPGFEEMGSNWVGKTNVNYDNKVNNPVLAENIISENVTLRFSAATAWADVSQSVKVEKGKSYKFGFTGRIQNTPGPENTPSTNRSFKMVVRNPSVTSQVYASSELVKTSKNTEVFGTFTVDDSYPDEVQINISKANGIAYADDVYLVEIMK